MKGSEHHGGVTLKVAIYPPWTGKYLMFQSRVKIQ